MFAPGRIIFLRPLKSTSSLKRTGQKLNVKSFDAVWITAQELAGEGILGAGGFCFVQVSRGRKSFICRPRLLKTSPHTHKKKPLSLSLSHF